MVIDAAPQADVELIEYQRQFALMQGTTREMQHTAENQRGSFVDSNIMPDASRPDGFTPVVLYHATRKNPEHAQKKHFFVLRVLTEPTFGRPDEETFPLIDQAAYDEFGEDVELFPVRRERFVYVNGGVRGQNESGINGSAEVMGLVREAIELVPPPHPASSQPSGV